MKRTTFIFLLGFAFSFILLSCHSNSKKKTEWTEEQKRKYFEEHIAYTYGNGFMLPKTDSANFEFFVNNFYPECTAKNRYNPYVYAFEENYIDSLNYDKNRTLIRITIDPCFRIPYCLILEKKKDKAYFTMKETNGNGGYYSGILVSTSTIIVNINLYDSISNELHKLNFWNLKKDTTCGLGSDGETWDIEAIDKGKYNLIERWVPYECGNSTTKTLGKIGIYLEELFTKHQTKILLRGPKNQDLKQVDYISDKKHYILQIMDILGIKFDNIPKVKSKILYDNSGAPGFKEQKGDTIIYWSTGGMGWADYPYLKSILNNPDFGRTRYITNVNNDGWVYVGYIGPNKFIIKNKTIYYVDEDDSNAVKMLFSPYLFSKNKKVIKYYPNCKYPDTLTLGYSWRINNKSYYKVGIKCNSKYGELHRSYIFDMNYNIWQYDSTVLDQKYVNQADEN